MDILLFGGAFDPVHNGHIAILRTAMKYKNFDKVIVMPTGTPGHKDNCKVPFAIRKYMAELAFKKLCDNVEVSAYEGGKLEKSYSYITVDYLKETYPDAKIYFIIGADSAINLKKWVNWQHLSESVTFLVFARDFEEDDELKKAVNEIRKFSPDTEILKSKIFPISSTQIRTLASKGESLRSYTDKDVAAIIKSNNLYCEDFYTRTISTAELLVPFILRRNRTIHTYNVETLAAELANIHGVSVDKARLAALLHDIMKQSEPNTVLRRARRSDIIERIDKKPYPVLHGFAAADYAKHEMGIEDEEILLAIKNHTCGMRGMCNLEKVIYLADMLCAERDFPEKERLLSLARQNLDIGMERALKSSIKWLKENGNEIDSDSIDALKYFEKLNNHGGNDNG